MRLAASAFLALIALATTSAVAQEGCSFGAGVSISSSPYVGEATQARAVPILRYQGDGRRI